MNLPLVTFHHLGLALREEIAALKFLQTLGYTWGEAFEEPTQQVILRMCRHPMHPSIELITPLGEVEGSPLANYLKASTALIYHICFECDAHDATIHAWQQLGHRIVTLSEPKPVNIFDGRRVAFYSVRGLGMIELLERAAP